MEPRMENIKLTVKYIPYSMAKAERGVAELDRFIYPEKSTLSYKRTERWVFFSIPLIAYYFIYN
jgi:hypothetical protein